MKKSIKLDTVVEEPTTAENALMELVTPGVMTGLRDFIPLQANTVAILDTACFSSRHAFFVYDENADQSDGVRPLAGALFSNPDDVVMLAIELGNGYGIAMAHHWRSLNTEHEEWDITTGQEEIRDRLDGVDVFEDSLLFS